MTTEERLTIWANSNVSRGKFAAAAVHAALQHYGIDHGAVIVLGASPSAIEVEPFTVTAGIRKATGGTP